MMKASHFLFLLVLSLFVVSSDGRTIMAANEAAESEEDTPVVVDPVERPPAVGVDRAWVAPNFTGQEAALGYGPDAFQVLPGMEERVAFWSDIYTKYTTDQGLLHDSRYVNIIYDALDFSDLAQDAQMSLHAKEKGRRDRVKKAKKEIEQRLERLDKLTSAEGLDETDKRYWDLFKNINEPHKFREAARRGRLRFQLGQRDRFMEGIYQSGRYLTEMEEIFRREGLPIELTRLPFVESSFNLKARSKVGASGIWQFMRSTARAYMRMDGAVDERNDPIRATLAAARKLRNNYQMLGNWPLAVTGYNHGPSGVQRLVRKYGTQNLAELTDVRKGRFGFASANFYASFLAALRVEQNAESLFGPMKRMAEVRGQEIKMTKNLKVRELISWFDGDLARCQMYNPHVRSHVWPNGIIYSRNFIRVPTEKAADVERAIANSPAVVVAANEPAGGSEYIIQEGETLGEIASRFKVKIQALLDINGISDARRVRAQQKLIIPEGARP